MISRDILENLLAAYEELDFIVSENTKSQAKNTKFIGISDEGNLVFSTSKGEVTVPGSEFRPFTQIIIDEFSYLLPEGWYIKGFMGEEAPSEFNDHCGDRYYQFQIYDSSDIEHYGFIFDICYGPNYTMEYFKKYVPNFIKRAVAEIQGIEAKKKEKLEKENKKAQEKMIKMFQGAFENTKS